MSLELKTRQRISDRTQHATEVEKNLQNTDSTQTCYIQREQLKITKDMVQYQSNVKLMDHRNQPLQNLSRHIPVFWNLTSFECF